MVVEVRQTCMHCTIVSHASTGGTRLMTASRHCWSPWLAPGLALGRLRLWGPPQMHNRLSRRQRGYVATIYRNRIRSSTVPD